MKFVDKKCGCSSTFSFPAGMQVLTTQCTNSGLAEKGPVFPVGTTCPVNCPGGGPAKQITCTPSGYADSHLGPSDRLFSKLCCYVQFDHDVFARSHTDVWRQYPFYLLPNSLISLLLPFPRYLCAGKILPTAGTRLARADAQLHPRELPKQTLLPKWHLAPMCLWVCVPSRLRSLTLTRAKTWSHQSRGDKFYFIPPASCMWPVPRVGKGNWSFYFIVLHCVPA